MESSKEPSPAPSTSSKGLKGTVAKARIARTGESSGSSLKETENEAERGGVRNSVDSLLDRTRGSRQASLDDGLPSGPSNLSKFVPGRVKKKKKKREEAERAQAEEKRRGRSIEVQRPLGPTAESTDNRSRSTLGDGEGSLTTHDSDPESPSITKPPLKSHDSHVGYLTSSSPLIKTTAPDNGLPISASEPSFQDPQYTKSSTLPTTFSTADVSGSLSPHHAATFDTRRGSQSPGGSRIRGVSPGAKIKEALTIGSRKKTESPPKSPDLKSHGSRSNSVIGDLMKKESMRKGLNLINGSRASESVSSLNDSTDVLNGQAKSTRDLPVIQTTPDTPTNTGTEPPETTVTPPTPVDQRRASHDSPVPTRPLSDSLVEPNLTVTPSASTISHRRVRSDTTSTIPTKLSQAIPPPMTPMAEETKTPGGTMRAPSQGSMSGGFFSSVFSAAQNMTSTLTNTISNPTRSRSSTATDPESTSIKDVDVVATGTGGDVAAAMGEEKQPLAVDTLGSGELSLRHLGISTESLVPNKAVNGLSKDDQTQQSSNIQSDEATARVDDASAARAVSAAYSERPLEQTPVADTTAPVKKSMATYAPSIGTEAGEKTPPTGSIYEGADSIRRSGSVRSRVGGRVRRHRNSSSATGNTVGTMIVNGDRLPSVKPAGFAAADKKRNREFHRLFKSVPEDDYLIEDYSSALQREIILAGRLYISESHICFSSNILGWVTTLVISFSEVVAFEKESTAVVFPNAIAVQTLHARHTFRSLLSRDATYELLVGIWKLTHPHLKTIGNSTRLDPDAEKVQKADPSGSDEISEESDEVYDEDQEDGDGTGSATVNGDGSVAASFGADEANGSNRKASAMGLAAGSAAVPLPTTGDTKSAEMAIAAGATSVDFPGPATHSPTECPDGASHLDKQLKDDIIPAPLGKVFSMTFGPGSGAFMSKWLVDDMKCTDLEFDDEAKKGLSEDVKSRSMTYIKPLYAPIGPKTTKCLVTETLDFFDLEKAVCVTASTQTPDVPSGNVFVTKTHFCFMWAANNATRAVMNYTIEWTGKSWLKGEGYLKNNLDFHY